MSVVSREQRPTFDMTKGKKLIYSGFTKEIVYQILRKCPKRNVTVDQFTDSQDELKKKKEEMKGGRN